MWKIPGRTSSLLLGGLFFFFFFFFLEGGVLEGKKSADKLDLVRLGASAVWSEISSQSFSKERGREGRGVEGVGTVIQLFYFSSTKLSSFEVFFYCSWGSVGSLLGTGSIPQSVQWGSLHTRKYKFIVLDLFAKVCFNFTKHSNSNNKKEVFLFKYMFAVGLLNE